MKVTIFNGEPVGGSPFDQYVQVLAARARAAAHEVEVLELRELDLKGCSGCFSCFVKTPGRCARRDDSERLCRAMLGSDLVVLASPMSMGFTTSLLKRCIDQQIPLIHPYLEIEGGEMHHKARYKRYPLLALVLGPTSATTSEDLEITQAIWARTARNVKSRLILTATTDRRPEEVFDALLAAA